MKKARIIVIVSFKVRFLALPRKPKVDRLSLPEKVNRPRNVLRIIAEIILEAD